MAKSEAGLDITFHQLDVTDKESIGQLAMFVEKAYGRLAGYPPDDEPTGKFFRDRREIPW
ncbi:MAG: hypothetical protein KC421_14090 [Anaerolineales bacterium]|nr:hypothetical protein [Anaerolineales bacterium]